VVREPAALPVDGSFDPGHTHKAGVEQLDRGEYTEYGEDSRQEFLADLDAICTVLSERYASGESDVASRHNEHQRC